MLFTARPTFHLLQFLAALHFLLAAPTSAQAQDSTTGTTELATDNSTRPTFHSIPVPISLDDITGPECSQPCIDTFVEDFIKAGECASSTDWECLCKDYATMVLELVYKNSKEMSAKSRVYKDSIYCSVKYCTKADEADFSANIVQYDKKCYELVAAGNPNLDENELANMNLAKTGELIDYLLDSVFPNRTTIGSGANATATSTVVVTQTATVERSSGEDEKSKAAILRASIPGLTIISGLFVGTMGYWVL